MATVSAGSSQTIILGPGDSVQVSTTPNVEGIVVVTPNGAGFAGPNSGPTATLSPQSFPIGPTAYGRLFGPYPMGATVLISARVGSITYTTSNGDPEAYTWAGRPDPTTMPVGAEITITDIGRGGSRWRNDGANWRPACGRVVMYQRASTLAAPLGTFTANAAAFLFTLPESLTIPQGIMAPHSRVLVQATIQRVSGAVGNATCALRLGAANSTADPAIALTTNGTTNPNTWLYGMGATAAGSSYVGISGTSRQIGGSGAGSLADYAQDNTAGPLYANIGFTTTNSAGDVFALIDYQVVLEA